jgi:phosphatidylserine/phosphatidylglycerophosphate/cardiolipin synthase-like enzyme
VVDGPQVGTVFNQWRDNGHSAWKIPLLAKALTGLDFTAKDSTPWSPESKLHDFMHCKMTVADDTVFLGSFNLSRSGEQNAENMLEVRDPELAGRMAAFIDEIRAKHPKATAPGER